MSEKYFYLHIPKTAGTTFNDFLENSFSSSQSLFHIEDKLEKIKDKKVIGGHLTLVKAQKVIPNFDSYIKLTVLRDPLAQVSSHLRFVKKLSEESEKERLMGHTDAIQHIASFLSTINFSNPKEIEELIKWLENKNYVLFHNTQMQYLVGSSFVVSQQQVEDAKKIIEKMNHIGITERLDDYIQLLIYKLGLPSIIKSKKLNNTSEIYGLDITNPLIVKALEPLVCYDKIIYEHAKKRFVRDFASIPRGKVKKYQFYSFLDRIRTKVKQRILR